MREKNGLGGVTSLVGDPHGTTLAAIPNTKWAANDVIKQYTDPFGAARGTAANIPGDRQFLDKTRDTATGLTMVGARYYDEANGRFISVDPLLDLADPQQWNAYAYANNNPTTLSDPSGLTPRIDDDYDGGRGPLAKRPPASSTPVPGCYLVPIPRQNPSPANVGPTAGEVGHVVVDVLGFVPGYGEVADLANAVWYGVEGDWWNSGLSGAGAFPGLGVGVTLFKWFRNGKKALEAAETAGDAASSVVTTERAAVQALKPSEAVARWDEFLGTGPTTNLHPRTGLPDPNRIVSADGTRSIRFGPHEMGSSPAKFHFHEETCNFYPDLNTWQVDNVLVRVPFPKGAW